jgi:hypothetical protein
MGFDTVFQQSGTFFKGNLHTHSTRSDGKWEPDAVVDAYRNAGYDFMSLTDHFLPARYFGKDSDHFITVTDTSALNSPDFLTIHGAELHAPALLTGDIWHIVAVGLPLDFPILGEGETGLEITRRAHEAGAFIGIAHPAWYGLTIEETLPFVPFSHAIEIYNTGSADVDRAESWHFADQMYARGVRLGAYAADDAHFNDPRGDLADFGGGWVHVKAESLDEAAILAALKAGHYYASTGPEIEDITFDGEVLRVRTSPIDQYIVSGAGARFARLYNPGQTSAEFPVRRPDGSLYPWAQQNYLRLTAVIDAGGRAWSNPIWLDEAL